MNGSAPSGHALRRYQVADAAACLRLFDLNTPRFFASDERDEFGTFLAQPEGEYLLVTSPDGEIVACGGYIVHAAKRAAALCWNMVHPAHHRQGIGQWLLSERLNRIRNLGCVDVLLDTSQHSAGFYRHCGFVADSEQIDGYAPGLHRIEMSRRLAGP